MGEGWIKVHRTLSHNQLWLSQSFTDAQAWVDLLMLANHQPGVINVRGIRLPIERGQVGWSEMKLAERWKWSRGKVRRFINYLCREKMIKTVQQKNKVTTLITILNYDIFQMNNTTNSTSDRHQMDTNKNKKNDKKTENMGATPKIFIPPSVEEVVAYFDEKGYNEQHARKVFAYYSAGNWKDRDGRQVQNWKQKCIANWMKEEGKKTSQPEKKGRYINALAQKLSRGYGDGQN